mgnify:CR=1 FL=1
MMNKAYPIGKGTFIQCDMAEGWSDKEWLSELGYLKEVEMEYIIIGTSQSQKTDVVDFCLKTASQMGMKVFVSINYNNGWFEKGSRDEAWLYEQMETDAEIADKLYKKYYHKYPHSFFGWYFTYEVDNMNFNSLKKFIVLTRALNILLKTLRVRGERLPILISPFMNAFYGTAKEYADRWAYLFTHSELMEGDIFCPQDCVGGGGLDITQVDEWFHCFREAVDKKPGLQFWANTETFDHENWCSAPLKRFLQQMKIESRYVDNIITFAYSHYYSPNNIDPRLHQIYYCYVKTGNFPSSRPKPPQNISVKNLGINRIQISWEPAVSGVGIFGYELYRNNKKIYSVCIQRKYGGNPGPLKLSYIDKEAYKLGLMALMPIAYDVKAIDMAGNSSG